MAKHRWGEAPYLVRKGAGWWHVTKREMLNGHQVAVFIGTQETARKAWELALLDSVPEGEYPLYRQVDFDRSV